MWTDCEPPAEVCNGHDDDCDGTTDEGANPCGGACELANAPGVACDGSDADRCTDDSYGCSGLNATTCSAGADNPETCNSIDDDCDGTTDEGSNACGGACALANAPGVACDGSDADRCLDDEYECSGLNATTCSAGADDLDVCCIGTDRYADGTVNPANQCEFCEPSLNNAGWTDRPNFTPCILVTEPDRSYDICVRGTCVSPGCGDATCNAPGPNWPLPDTNQRTCYNNSVVLASCPGTAGAPDCGSTEFCGQDAQYGWDTEHAATERFTRTGEAEPVVTDNVTGLVWQGCAAGLTGSSCGSGSATGYVWSSALAYCDSLSWGGSTDWRLPDRYELSSIVDYGRPGINSAAFPATLASLFWSSSSYGDSSWARFVGFGSGDVNLDAKRNANYVRCVRGEPSPGPTQRFTRSNPVAGQPVVADAVTGLVWQGCAVGQTGGDCSAGRASPLNWQGALAYCENLDWGGHTDWYLPNVTELAGITDDSRLDPAIDPAFPATPASSFWWSSSSASSSSSAWVLFGSGSVSSILKTNGDYVRCVRRGP
jgi:hypothetical protein